MQINPYTVKIEAEYDNMSSVIRAEFETYDFKEFIEYVSNSQAYFEGELKFSIQPKHLVAINIVTSVGVVTIEK